MGSDDPGQGNPVQDSWNQVDHGGMDRFRGQVRGDQLSGVHHG